MKPILFLSLFVCVIIQDVASQGGHEPEDNDFMWGTFPEGFLWGSATSSYQIEGAWDAQGKGENIWDRFVHQGNNVLNNDTGDVACSSYYKYRDDVRLLKEMGVNFYRFSLSWARLMPDGTNSRINQAGIRYYNMLINELLAEGIIPMVTLYHWDLPQHLQDVGGWENESLINHFKNYADLCFAEFGDRVKLWNTFNEPLVTTVLGYGYGLHAPGLTEIAELPYQTTHVIIKAHAEAWHLYNDNYRATQKGEVGIVLNYDWSEPLNPEDPLDVEAADRVIQFCMGWYGHPIYVNGDYPQVMKDYVGNKSLAQGYPRSRLPTFTESEKARIAGTSDFFGLNHYTTHYTYHLPDPDSPPSFDYDADIGWDYDSTWAKGGSDWLYVVPWGLRKHLQWVKREYNNPKIIITENGYSDLSGTVNDPDRIKFFKRYINNVLKAIRRDGVDVRGYTAWSLLDNFEWGSGYGEKFGLHQVDFTDPSRPRTAKDSARYYAQIIRDNGFVDHVSSTTNIPTDVPGSGTTVNLHRSAVAMILSVLLIISIYLVKLN